MREHIRTGDQTEERGFTLIELLTVIAIIAILAALLLPGLARGKLEAYRVVCANNLHQMSIGLQLYTQDNKGEFPRWANDNPNASGGPHWDSALIPYDHMQPSNAVSHCPIYIQTGGMYSPAQPDDSGGIFGSYGINWGESSIGFQSLGISPVSAPFPSVNEAQVLAPGELYVMADTREFHVPPGQEDYFLGPWEQTGFSFGWTGIDPFIEGYVQIISAAALTNEFAPPHAQGYNVAHADGHVALIKRRMMYYPPVAASHWYNDNRPHPESWQPRSQWAVQQ